MGNPLPGGYDEDGTTTTTTSPAAVDPAGEEGWQGPPAGETSTPLKSAWGRDFTSRQYIQATYYWDSATGTVVPLIDRLQQWRQQYAQTGNADLGGVLDHYLAWKRTDDSTEGNYAAGKKDVTIERNHERRTVASWMEGWRTASTAEITTLQKDLFEAGYFSPDVYKHPEMIQAGVYDPLTQEAATHLLKDGTMSDDVPLEELIRTRMKAIAEAGGVEAWLELTGQVEAPPPFQATVTNPADIVAAGRDVARELTGREISGFGQENVAEFQGAEAGAQRSAYNLAVNEQEGTVVEAPSLGAFTEEELRAEHGAEVGAYSYLGNFNALLQRAGLAG